MPPVYKYVQIAFNLPLDKLFYYRIPDNLQPKIKVGQRVLAPFGVRKLTGYVAALSANCSKEFSSIKSILDILDDEPLITPQVMQLARWISKYYICPLGICLAGMLPKGIDIQSWQRVIITDSAKILTKTDMPDGINGEIISLLLQNKTLSVSQLKKRLNKTDLRNELNELKSNGLLTIENKISTPKVKPLMRKKIEPAIPIEQIESIMEDIKKKAPKQALVLSTLIETGGSITAAQLKSMNIAASCINSLIDKGIIKFSYHKVSRFSLPKAEIPAAAPKSLLPQQQAVVDLTAERLINKKHLTILLHGVTGSGKTEVYLQAIEKCLTLGRSAIVLIPEISLTAQTWERFYGRFGDKVALLHSQLSAGERFDQWHRLYSGEAKIAIGARSAIFAPLKDVGLIVVDEEHETSYKQDNRPHYHAVAVAVMRAKFERAVAILGSATPSLESYYKCKTNKYYLANLTKRIGAACLPEVKIIDMRHQVDKKALSAQLKEAIRLRLVLGEQSLLFLNRRGYNPFIICTDCGQMLYCPQCSVSLTFHKNGKARCHYCNYAIIPPKFCSTCKSEKFEYLGLGTQRLEEQLISLFPKARIARMDRDTTGRKGAHWRLFKQLQNREIDIIIGTKMITKGFDLPGITLVGVLCADFSLGMPDFRAAEQTFQILTQVAGRAGRGDISGEVLIQTYNPAHYSIKTAGKQDYESFYRQEIIYRRRLYYPPAAELIGFMLQGKNESQVGRAAYFLVTKLKPYLNHRMKLLGPAPASISKIKGNYRWQLIIKGQQLARLHSALENVINILSKEQVFKGVSLEIDVDPVNLL